MSPNVRFITRALVLALLLWAAPAMAGDVDGIWAGTVSTPGGDFPVAFEFKSDGTKLTGTTMSPDGGSVNIKDGKIDGNKISFIVAIDFGGMPVMIGCNGVVVPAEIKFTGDFMGMPFEFTVTKAK